jgi:hypothetical protein
MSVWHLTQTFGRMTLGRRYRLALSPSYGIPKDESKGIEKGQAFSYDHRFSPKKIPVCNHPWKKDFSLFKVTCIQAIFMW